MKEPVNIKTHPAKSHLRAWSVRGLACQTVGWLLPQMMRGMVDLSVEEID